MPLTRRALTDKTVNNNKIEDQTISLGTLGNKVAAGKIDGVYVHFTTSVTAGWNAQEQTVSHNLGRVPQGWIVVFRQCDSAGNTANLFRPGPGVGTVRTAWTSTAFYIHADRTGVPFVLLLF